MFEKMSIDLLIMKNFPKPNCYWSGRFPGIAGNARNHKKIVKTTKYLTKTKKASINESNYIEENCLSKNNKN